MASFLDIPSSPDPLTEEVDAVAPTSSTRPTTTSKSTTRRPMTRSSILRPSTIKTTAKSQRSQGSATSARKSPRKQTFELDVGNERSPQKLLVTVEAEDDDVRGGVSRRLFGAASPTRDRSRSKTRREVQTTTVPLRGLTDDEGDGDTTIQRRGRLRLSNGTPMPATSKKRRAGTPLEKSAKGNTRRRIDDGDDLASDTGSVLRDVETNGSKTDIGLTPKPKSKAKSKNTPRKNAKTPSGGGAKGKKNGRSRKSVAAEVEPIEEEGPEKEEILQVQEDAQKNQEEQAQHENSKLNSIASRPPIEDDLGETPQPDMRPSELGNDTPQDDQRMNDDYDNDAALFDNLGSPSPPTDLESELQSQGTSHYPRNQSEHDNFTHASDFSMIAVDTLPSFQASFQASRSGFLPDDEVVVETGEETRQILDQTLKSFRRSTQDDREDGSELDAAQEDPDLGAQDTDVHAHDHGDDDSGNIITEPAGTTINHDEQEPPPAPESALLPSSPWRGARRKPAKRQSLSRQVLTRKSPGAPPIQEQDDDSFSAIPDSILDAQTPGRYLPSRKSPTPLNTTADLSTYLSNHEYDDSFSEIPDAILDAATPMPPPRREMSSARTPTAVSITKSSASRSISSRDSQRLPTPEGTNSSTTNSKSGAEPGFPPPATDEAIRMIHTSDLHLHSSPPVRLPQEQQPIINIENTEISNNITHRGDANAMSSPQLPLAHDSQTPEHQHSLELPTTGHRPSLSPIVRVARTLQHVITDRSSPNAREEGLKSPFRSSGNGGDAGGGGAGAGSPHRAHRRTSSGRSRASTGATAPIATMAQTIRSGFGQISLGTGNLEDPFGPDVLPNGQPQQSFRRSSFLDGSEREVLRREMENERERVKQKEKQSTETPPLPLPPTTDSIGTTILPSDNEQLETGKGWPADESPAADRTRRQSISRKHGRGGSVTWLDMTNPSITRSNNTDHDVIRPGAWNEDLESEQPGQEGEVEEEAEEQGLVALDDEGDGGFVDDGDLWDFEASRATPSPQTRRVLESAVQKKIQPASALPSTSTQNPSRPDRSQPKTDRPTLDRSKLPSPSQFMDDDDDDPREEIERPPLPSKFTLKQTESHAERSETYELLDFLDQDVPEDIESDHEHEEESQDFRPQVSMNSRHEDRAFDESKEYSTIEQPRTTREDAQAQQDAAASKGGIFGTFDLLSFFSSPTSLPRLPGQAQSPPIPHPVPNRPQQVRQNFESSSEGPSSAPRAPGLFPTKRLQPSSDGPTFNTTDTVPDTYAVSSPSSRRELEPDFQQDVQHTPLPTIPQKRNFTPNTGQSRNTASLFDSSRPTTPVRPESAHSEHDEHDHQMLDRELQRSVSKSAQSHRVHQRESELAEQQDESMLSQESEYERLPPRKTPSRWDRHRSPVKSCLRSPLKPRTPGRVVEFDGDFSPLAEAHERAERRGSIGGDGRSGLNMMMTGALESTQDERMANPNQPKDRRRVNLANPPVLLPQQQPQPQARPSPARPSAPSRPTGIETQQRPPQHSWTKAHWEHLDALFQLRRHDPAVFRRHVLSLPTHQHSNASTERESAALIGKAVRAQGVTMVLETWHMEVCEGFRRQEGRECGGVWNAKVLARRLFALILGEERRRKAREARDGVAV